MPASERIGAAANGLWMSQIGRNLTDAVDGILSGKHYLIHDRDPLFTAEFLEMLADMGVKSVKLPPRAPNLNAYAERFVRTIKESCLERMILFGEESLRTAIHNFVVHYHTERNHQGLGNRLTIPQAGHLVTAGAPNKFFAAEQFRRNCGVVFRSKSTVVSVRLDGRSDLLRHRRVRLVQFL